LRAELVEALRWWRSEVNFMRTSNGSAIVAVMYLRVSGAVQKLLLREIV
jgi:hypothetical protein